MHQQTASGGWQLVLSPGVRALAEARAPVAAALADASRDRIAQVRRAAQDAVQEMQCVLEVCEGHGGMENCGLQDVAEEPLNRQGGFCSCPCIDVCEHY